jgi:hypothetical protein
MTWQVLGFKANPLKTTPITQATLQLFTGHDEQARICSNVLHGDGARIVIEGARGVGTTSFANFLRFNAQAKQLYFTPRAEIKVEAGWRLETLLAAIISNLIREIELLENNNELIKDKRFIAAKALSSRIAETYRSFGVDAFGFGASYGKQAGPVTQPTIVPSCTLGHHLEDLALVVKEAGYKHGVLIQLNNLDVGEIHSEAEMKYLFNALRDYTQTEGTSWLFVGDVGLRRFIAQQVDRLDDIISYEVFIDPLPKQQLKELINKRIAFYQESPKAVIPIEQDVFNYLYELTNGRLRYVFGLASRLMNSLYIGDLTDKVTLPLAKPMLAKLGKDRLQSEKITESEEFILQKLIKRKESSATQISQATKKSSQYTGRLLNKLAEQNLVTVRQQGKEKLFAPSIEVIIAYSA